MTGIAKNSISSVTQLCLTLCDPMDSSMPTSLSLIISWSLLKLMSIELVMPFNHLILCCSLLLPSIFPSSGSFPMSWLFSSGGQSVGASASASVLPMNNQHLFPLGLTGLISLEDCQESPPTTQFKSINSLVLSLLYGPILTSIHDY